MGLNDRMSYRYGDSVRRPVVVAVEQAGVDPDVQPSVRAEGEAVEPLELLRGGVDRLLVGEGGAVPAAPLPQPPLRALGRDRAAADVQRALVPREAGDELRRSGDQRPRAVLQHEHAPVRHLVRFGTAVTLEHVAAAEGERRGGVQAGCHQLNLMPVGGLGWRRGTRGHRGTRHDSGCNSGCGDQRRSTSTHTSAPFECARSTRRFTPTGREPRKVNTKQGERGASDYPCCVMRISPSTIIPAVSRSPSVASAAGGD